MNKLHTGKTKGAATRRATNELRKAGFKKVDGRWISGGFFNVQEATLLYCNYGMHLVTISVK